MDTVALRATLAPAGVLRAAINLGNLVLAQQGENGVLDGVSVRLARKLGERLGVPMSPYLTEMYRGLGQSD